MNCELEPFGGCGGGTQHHHWISRAKLQGAKKARAYVETNPEVLMAWLCANHNDKFGGGDTKWAQAFIAYGKCVTWGVDVVSDHLETLRTKFKGSRPELGLEAILHSGRY